MPRKTTGFQPMLVCNAPEDLSKLRYPIWASRKLDGVRCVIRDGVPMSRSLKPIQNGHISRSLAELNLPNLDGELMVEGAANFSEVTSAVMSVEGWPAFSYNVFDLVLEQPLAPYWRRYNEIKKVVAEHPTRLKLVRHWEVGSVKDLRADEALVLEDGYEGLVLRDSQGPYKYGRATQREGWIMRLTQVHTDEARILAMIELQRNDNELETDERGYAKRSSAKAGKVPAGVLGSFVCEWSVGGEPSSFDLGTGFDAGQRADFWARQGEVLTSGLLAKFKYKGIGSKGKPRHPVFLGLRDPRDV